MYGVHQCPRARDRSPDQASSVSSGQPASRNRSQCKRPHGAYPELSRSSSTNGLRRTIITAPICLPVLSSLRSSCFMMPPGRVQNIQCPVVVAGFLPCMKVPMAPCTHHTIDTPCYGAGFKMSRFSRLGFSLLFPDVP